MELSADLPPALVPVAWLLGVWQGAGVGGYPTVPEFRFGQEVVFAHDGRPFLSYTSRSWLLDEDGNEVRPLGREAGFWRPQPEGVLEVSLSHPTGYAELWLGTVDGPRVELRTDVVVRTSTAKDYSAGHRLYGLVEGDLAWAFDIAAMGHPLQPHLSARLKRAS
jgi:hypothetical protein